jgi:digeranylgeranylglycerophospholipid reductase
MASYVETVLKRSYDAVVVGGGPAGAAAAAALARAGVNTLIVERKGAVGRPVRCAEGVPRARFESLVGPAEAAWVSAPVNGGVGHSPADIRVRRDYPGVGYILNRAVFDRAVWERAVAAGATPLPETVVAAVQETSDGVTVDLLRDGRAAGAVAARAVVGADGVESVVGRGLGLATALAAGDVDSCAAYVLADADEEYDDYIHFFLGHGYAPGGYAWRFPKGNGLANVGVGITPTMAAGRTAFDYLDAFVAGRYPRARVVEVRGGVVPVAKPLAHIVTAHAALVGDAARQTDPFSGEGICQALTAGAAAGAAVARGLADGDLAAALAAYEADWRASYGERYAQHYRVRRVILALSDKEMDDTVRIIRDHMDIATIKPSDIFATFLKALWKNPRLVLKFRHLLT